ncbi:hypothetical protein BJ742DRAFT_813864 [Cladochytrium replicatum]|nr:hypothetical protein BJ742DRAFT_813864 [Cladochytrium replicatum]
MSIKAALHNEKEVLGALESVRDDKNETNWVVLTHHNDDPNSLELQATGSNGFAGLQAALTADKVQYGLLRITTRVDLSVTVKFIYVYNLGEKVSFVKKGRFGIVKGDATRYFTPYHVDIEISSPDELIEEEIIKKVQDAAGTAEHLIENTEGRQERGYTARMQHSTNPPSGGRSSPTKVASTGVSPTSGDVSASPATVSIADRMSNLAVASAQSSSPKPAVSAAASHKPMVSMQSSGVTIDPQLLEAVKDVRNDKSSTKWVLGTYRDGNISNPVVLVATGPGSVEDLKAKLSDGQIAYALIRVTDMIDGHPTIKFALVTWIGGSVSIMKKAKIATHKGGVSEAFTPFHVDLTVSVDSELSDEIVLSKVQAMSGSKSFVK